MKDYEKTLQYNGRDYRLVFNLNVMEAIQAEYGSLDVWGDLTDGEEYSKRAYEKAMEGKKNVIPWEMLPDKDKKKYDGEPDAKAVIFGFTEMLNEGIDIDNEENGTDLKPLTKKQVGRIISEVGLRNVTTTLNEAVVESTKSDEIKNA